METEAKSGESMNQQRRKWTFQEDALLKKLVLQGLSDTEIES